MLVEFAFNFFPKIKLDKPIYDGFIYFGEPDSDPYFNTSKRIDVTYIGDDGLEKDLVQPLRTSKGGVPIVDGEYVKIFISQDYAMTAAGKNNEQILYVPSSKDFESNERITEDVFLSDGQVKVFFNRVQTTDLSYYISGTFVDRGRLDEGIDYTIVGDNNILLTNSFPAGSVLSGMQNAIEGESDTASTNINRTKAISDGYILTNLDSQSILTFDASIDATINVPDGLTLGVGVIVLNTGSGGVIISMGAEVLRGNNELVDRSGQLMIVKFSDTLWQSSERGTSGVDIPPVIPPGELPDPDPDLPVIAPPATIPEPTIYNWGAATRTEVDSPTGLSSSIAFGESCAISGDGNTLAVLEANDVGWIQIYNRVANDWVFSVRIVSDRQIYGSLQALEFNQDGTVLVANFDNQFRGIGVSINFVGVGLVYSLVSGVWDQSQVLQYPESGLPATKRDDLFGQNISIGTDWIVASSLKVGYQSNIAEYNGALYFFKVTDGIYDYKQKISIINSVELGSNVLLSGDDSACFAITGTSAYVFSNDSGVWNFRHELTGFNSGFLDIVPMSTNYLGSILAVGNGPCEIYYGSGESWVLDGTITATVANYMNLSLSYDGNSIAVAYPTYNNWPTVTGLVEVYSRVSTVWTLQTSIDGDLSGLDPEFGQGLALHSDGSNIAIGNPKETAVNQGGGTIYRGSVTFIDAN